MSIRSRYYSSSRSDGLRRSIQRIFFGSWNHRRPVGRYLHTLAVKETQLPPDFGRHLIENSNLTKNGKSLHQDTLPKACPGCGAVTQGPSKEIDAGYFDLARKSVREFSAQTSESGIKPVVEAKIFDHVLHNFNQPLRAHLGIGTEDLASEGGLSPEEVPVPVCNRCHHIVHHGRGESIVHPTLQSIHQIISESPHKYNHVYHILDAADFPLSIIPQLHRRLSLTPQRSPNRRAKFHKFYKGREAELSFIITRADLLAPQKQQVDSLMPYLVQVLRDALRSTSEAIRLGNVRCVSATRGWWTKQVKEDILTRGGGAWMVGRVNVGKSQLLECIYPKGRLQNTSTIPPPQSKEITLATEESSTPSDLTYFKSVRPGKEKEASETLGTISSSKRFLMPPLQAERQFPVLPLVSALPGTTVSPIRLPFGGGQGELFDLPGLPRSSLEDHVIESSKSDLVMRHRVKPKQYVISPGKSLLLGGLIRITPASSDVTLLAHPFVPLTTHITTSEKAVGIHTQRDASLVPTIARPGTGQKMSLAGTFPLKWDVTKQRSGPLTSKAAAGLKTKDLPFLIFATDILIEGCGWIEVAAQVRRKAWEGRAGNGDGLEGITQFPTVEIWSPNGDYVAQRQPMNGWALGGPKRLASSRRTARPRRSMKGAKKRLKGKI